jgi:hypothetical protein
MGMSFKKELKQWENNLIGLIASIITLILLVFYYNEIVFSKTFGSTNDQMMRFFLRLLDKKGGKLYAFGFIILLILFFGVSAFRGYQKDKMMIAKQLSENNLAAKQKPKEPKFVSKPIHEKSKSIPKIVQEEPFDHYDHCPACGFKLNKSDKECPDCGLNLS